MYLKIYNAVHIQFGAYLYMHPDVATLRPRCKISWLKYNK